MTLSIGLPFNEGPRRRYILGVGLIILVVLCWVGGDEITQIIFKKKHFDQPFFLVYFKTSMFMVYLVKMVKYLPRLCGDCVVPVARRNRDEFLGPSSYERLEYDRSESDSNMTNCSDDELLLSSEIRDAEESYLRDTSSSVSSMSHPPPATLAPSKKGVLKKSSSLPLPNAESEAVDIEAAPRNIRFGGHDCAPVCSVTSSSTGPVDHSVSMLECSTSKKIKFKAVAEVRCLAPHHLTEQREARRPYNARADLSRLSFKEHMKVAAVYSILWFLGNYLNTLALEKTALSYVEVLSASSSVFVLFMSAAFPVGSQDKISLTKFLVILVNMAGVVTLTLSESDSDDVTVVLHRDASSLFGIMFAIAAALIYAVYMVYFRRVAGSPDGSDDRVDMVLFFGTVGLLSAVFLLPLFPILHYSGVETFKWPDNKDWKYLVITAVLGTVISDLLMLWSTLLTTSLIVTIGLGLTSPVSVLVDIMLNKQKFSVTFFVGVALLGLSFVVLNILCFLEHSDPVLRWVLRLREKVQLKFGWGSTDRTHSEIQGLLDATTASSTTESQTSESSAQ